MDLVFLRDKISSDNLILEYIFENYGEDATIRYSNSGFIVISPKSNTVFKYYCGESYLIDKFNFYNFYDFYNLELNCYNLFSNNGFLIPKIYSYGLKNIGKYTFNYIELENIRLNNIKLNDFFDIDLDKICFFIKKIHSLNSGYILGNIDISNFYIDKDGTIGFFDFSGYGKGNVEKDLAKIFYGFKFKYNYINKFISLYGEELINIKLLLIEFKRVYVENNEIYKKDFYISFKMLTSKL